MAAPIYFVMHITVECKAVVIVYDFGTAFPHEQEKYHNKLHKLRKEGHFYFFIT